MMLAVFLTRTRAYRQPALLPLITLQSARRPEDGERMLPRNIISIRCLQSDHQPLRFRGGADLGQGTQTPFALGDRTGSQHRLLALISKAVRLLTRVTMLGWGAHLSIEAISPAAWSCRIDHRRWLGPIEGAIEGWSQVCTAYGRMRLLQTSPEFRTIEPSRGPSRRRTPSCPGNQARRLNGISFALSPDDSLAIIGNSGAGKAT